MQTSYNTLKVFPAVLKIDCYQNLHNILKKDHHTLHGSHLLLFPWLGGFPIWFMFQNLVSQSDQ